ncbi:MAG: lipid A deacylase LpxR family protein [Aquisalinus sp.]|nr:lipid A deacylase LpxR family protein [Aquisalinus sp.]
MNKNRTVAIALAGSLSLMTGTALAEDATYTVVIENDYVFNQDRDYSSGFQLDYVSPAKQGRDGLTGRIARDVLQATSSDPVRKRIAVGQYIFIPEDTSSPGTPGGQHPYAGFLYGTYGVLAQKGQDRLDSFHIQVGLTGEPSLAEEVQDVFHNAFGDDEAQGWDSQLDTELAFAATYDQARKYPVFQWGDLESEVIANAGLTAGTLLTQAHVAANWRLGFDLGDDFGPVKLYPYVSAGQWDNQSRLSGYIYLGGTVRAVARDIFLDGNTFSDSESVDKEFFVPDWNAGAVVQLGVAQVSFTYQERGQSYETQDTPHKTASVNFSLGL